MLKILDHTTPLTGSDNYREVERCIANRTECRGNSMGARWLNGQYIVTSYATVIATVDGDNVEIADNRWGPTTGRHINICKRAL